MGRGLGRKRSVEMGTRQPQTCKQQAFEPIHPSNPSNTAPAGPPTRLKVDFFLVAAAGAGEGLALGLGEAGVASSLLEADESLPSGEGSPATAGLRYWHLQQRTPSAGVVCTGAREGVPVGRMPGGGMACCRRVLGWEVVGRLASGVRLGVHAAGALGGQQGVAGGGAGRQGGGHKVGGVVARRVGGGGGGAGACRQRHQR